MVETLPRETLKAVSDASSSLSVSPKSKGGFMIGALSKKSKRSNPVPLPKNDTSKVQSSLQSDPARAMKRCCNASALRAAALCSSSAANLNNQRACKNERYAKKGMKESVLERNKMLVSIYWVYEASGE